MKKYFKTELIENFIKAKGWSISKFCKECKIGVVVYRKIMNQQLNFRTIALFKIARVMNVGLKQLYC